MPRDWMPTTSYDAAAGVARAGGYTGQGVATANLWRILTDLISGAVTPLTQLPTVTHRSPAGSRSRCAGSGSATPRRGLPASTGMPSGQARRLPDARWWSGLAATKLGEESAL